MILKTIFRLLIFFVIAGSARLAAIESYEVHFHGEIPANVLNLLQCSSDLFALRNSPPATEAGLRHRAEADLKNFLDVLHSQAYYHAIIDIEYNFEQQPAIVTVNVETGPIYPLQGFSILPAPGSECTYSYETIDLCDLGITLQTPAFPKQILEAEEALLSLLARKGYPLAKITNRQVIADQQQQAIFVTLYVNSGSLAYFGPTTITGNCSVREEFIKKKICWETWEPYSTRKIERTQAAMEASGLFTSIAIKQDDHLMCDHELPIHIEVEEAKHRSIGWGLTYATHRGPGLTFEWEHRNISGMGDKLSFDTDLWFDTQTAKLSYLIPEFREPGQDFLWIAEGSHEDTKGFDEMSFSLSGLIEKQLNRHLRISYGGTYKILHDTHAEIDGMYNILKAPMYLRLNRANSLLDPTSGATLHLKIIPSWQFLHPQFVYCINTITGTKYIPLTEDHRYVFAAKAMFGTILGSNRRSIPTSERFFEGNDATMRGYRYLTVSPLDGSKPTGGRSLLISSFELRVRATECFGWVAFYEIGNVYANAFPELNKKQLQSIGYGLRYHTPVGPLRLDFGIPLNRRRHLDRKFEVYLSIGQAF